MNLGYGFSFLIFAPGFPAFMTSVSPRYRGRFAPSPTGPLHFGSLVAAVGSFLDARRRGGQWLVRIEDIDSPRVMAGAVDDILRTLEAFGLHWDGEVLRQSRRGEAYREALDAIERLGMLYPCNCSRRELADSADVLSSGLVYPGYCRLGMRRGRKEFALRVRTDDHAIEFHDRLQGHYLQCLESEVGDFVLRRADGLFAYQLAVVVDDGEQGITDIVRGADILDSTPRQIYLQRLLGLPTPSYLHLPVMVNRAGEKLSKQTLAPAVNSSVALATLVKVLAILGQEPPQALLDSDLTALWEWAVAHWQAEKIPARRVLHAP